MAKDQEVEFFVTLYEHMTENMGYDSSRAIPDAMKGQEILEDANNVPELLIVLEIEAVTEERLRSGAVDKDISVIVWSHFSKYGAEEEEWEKIICDAWNIPPEE